MVASNPLLQWAILFLTSLLVVGLLLMLSPCVIRFIQDQIQKLSNRIANQLLLQNFQSLTKIGLSRVNIGKNQHHPHLLTITVVASMTPRAPNKDTDPAPSQQEAVTED